MNLDHNYRLVDQDGKPVKMLTFAERYGILFVDENGEAVHPDERHLVNRVDVEAEEVQ